MNQESIMDEWLEKRVCEYDEWLKDKKIPFSSKVVPVAESFSQKQWVLPTERVIKYIEDARSFAIAKCVCRSHYNRCDNPIEICFFINDVSDKLVKTGYARRLSFEEAAEKLHEANKNGLVHLTLYSPKQYPYAICSCCHCCCHDLQLLLDYDRQDLVAKSEYISAWDETLCDICGLCVDRCVFGARITDGNIVKYDAEKCYGCGLCVTCCPNGAIRLERK